ncbi:unnamed protein product [Soboliphyme baturini]|uniref:MSP domain-containing protein n=1 Tax=Soboliphyme baturini TaxID=241478 RepID=A0A183IXW0_9BILA|nr:unnamed protein product [Soboliphyme baturini]
MEHPKSYTAPSQVLHVKFSDRNTYTITEPFADDGSTLNASSVALYHKNTLLIGTINHKLMICLVKL